MGKIAFKTLLWTLGLMMERASKKNDWFRNQVTADMVVEVRSRDGVAHHFVFTRSTRRMASRKGPAGQPTVSVCFATAGHGFRSLANPHATSKIVNGALDGTVTVDGNPSLLLWFWGLTRVVIPIGRIGPNKHPLPGAWLKPNPDSAVSGAVTREAVATALDPEWKGAVAARATLINLRSPGGEQCPMW